MSKRTAKRERKAKKWYQKWPEYPLALALAKRLLRRNEVLVDSQWEAEQLSSWLVKPIRSARRSLLPRHPRKRSPRC